MVKSTDGFFDEQTANSKMKSRIVSKYFSTWMSIMVNVAKKQKNMSIYYIDLYAGAGVYKDGSYSTPLLILDSIKNHKEASKYIKLIFNEKDKQLYDSLVTNVANHPAYSGIKKSISFYNHEISDSFSDDFNFNDDPKLIF